MRGRRAVRCTRIVRVCRASAVVAARIIQTATAILQNAARCTLSATAIGNAAPCTRCVTAIGANAARFIRNATAPASAAVVIRSARAICTRNTALTSAARFIRIARVSPSAIIADIATAPNTAVSVKVIIFFVYHISFAKIVKKEVMKKCSKIIIIMEKLKKTVNQKIEGK